MGNKPHLCFPGYGSGRAVMSPSLPFIPEGMRQTVPRKRLHDAAMFRARNVMSVRNNDIILTWPSDCGRPAGCLLRWLSGCLVKIAATRFFLVNGQPLYTSALVRSHSDPSVRGCNSTNFKQTCFLRACATQYRRLSRRLSLRTGRISGFPQLHLFWPIKLIHEPMLLTPWPS